MRAAFLPLLLAAASPVLALEIEVLKNADPAALALPVKSPEGRVLDYSIGIGSGAFRHPADPANVVWTVGDRGPNFTCAEAAKVFDAALITKCKALANGRLYPSPGYAPSIYKVEIDRGAKTFRVVQTIPLKSRSGKPVLGLLNPQTKATKDTGIDLSGTTLPDSADNVDLEGIIRLSDGTFWIGEEMGPSIAHVGPDGRILRRHVPADQAEDYRAADTEVIANLPAILSKRQGNRGIESMAVSPDEAFLYFIMQNPLANPDAKAYQAAKNARLFKFDRVKGQVVGEYVYQLDGPQSFGLDPSDRQSDPRISELLALGPDRLLVLERTEGTTKLHEVSLAGATNILGTQWDDAASRPSLEQQNGLAAIGIVPVTKVLRFDQARDFKDAPAKLEGLALLGDGALMMINDNDFGIRGDETTLLILRGAVSADREAYAK
jgi:hypothetical protein